MYDLITGKEKAKNKERSYRFPQFSDLSTFDHSPDISKFYPLGQSSIIIVIDHLRYTTVYLSVRTNHQYLHTFSPDPFSFSGLKQSPTFHQKLSSAPFSFQVKKYGQYAPISKST